MEGGGFLPPRPPDEDPDIAPRPQSQPPPPPPEQPAWQPPHPGTQQPPPGYWQPQQPPPGYWQPQPWQGGPPEPDNGPAVTGFVLALIAAGILVLSVGLLAFVALVVAIFGLVYSRRGRRKVEVGETGKHRGLAQAGFVISIISLVIAVPVTLLEIVFVIAYATDEEFRDDFQDEFDDEFDPDEDSENFELALRIGIPLLRAAARLIA